MTENKAEVIPALPLEQSDKAKSDTRNHQPSRQKEVNPSDKTVQTSQPNKTLPKTGQTKEVLTLLGLFLFIAGMLFNYQPNNKKS